MSDVDPIEFRLGKLCELTQATHDMVKDMDKKQDSQHDRITKLESHNDMVKKAVKWIGGGITAVCTLVAWVLGSN